MPVHFIIPIRHPSLVRDVELQSRLLNQTLRAIVAQTCPNWTCAVVANRAAPLPALPDGCAVEHVDFPPVRPAEEFGSKEAFYEQLRLDKGSRVLAAAVNAPRDAYIMNVDDDDLVSRHLVAFLEDEGAAESYYISKGYLWTTNDDHVTPISNFHKRSGTSLIVRGNFWLFTKSSDGAVSEDAIKELGGHRIPFDRATREGATMAEIPFPAAVYRLGLANVSQVDVAVVERRATEGRFGRFGVKTLARRVVRAARARILGSPAPSAPHPRQMPIDDRMRADFLGAAAG